MIRKFMRTLFKTRPSLKEQSMGIIVSAPIATTEESLVVRPCAKCGMALHRTRKVYCSVVCKNTDKEGTWRKGLLKGGKPRKTIIVKQMPRKQNTAWIENPPIAVPMKRGPYKKKQLAVSIPLQEETLPPVKNFFLPLSPKYSTLFSGKTHRERIKEFSKW